MNNHYAYGTVWFSGYLHFSSGYTYISLVGTYISLVGTYISLVGTYISLVGILTFLWWVLTFLSFLSLLLSKKKESWRFWQERQNHKRDKGRDSIQERNIRPQLLGAYILQGDKTNHLSCRRIYLLHTPYVDMK